MNTNHTNLLPAYSDTLVRQYYAHRGSLASLAMERRVRRGQTIARPPLGYLTPRTQDSPVELDPERAPLIKEAFELAATKKYSLRKLLKVMTEKGLRSRTGRPLSVSALWTILQNPFYAGKLRFKGELAPGRHVPLVPQSIFGKVLRDRFIMRKNTKSFLSL